MMRLRPIPASLMPSAMTVRVPVQGDYSGEYSPPVTVERVRFDTYEALARRDYKLMDGSQGLVYIDAATSSPAFELPPYRRSGIGQQSSGRRSSVPATRGGAETRCCGRGSIFRN